MTKVLLLMLGGAVGTYLRYVIGVWVKHQPWGASFPWGTLIINACGSLLLGVAFVLFLERMPHAYEQWFLLLGTGLCGGFTTFSTFELDTYELVQAGQWLPALGYIAGSMLAGFLGVALGIVGTRWVLPPP